MLWMTSNTTLDYELFRVVSIKIFALTRQIFFFIGLSTLWAIWPLPFSWANAKPCPISSSIFSRLYLCSSSLSRRFKGFSKRASSISHKAQEFGGGLIDLESTNFHGSFSHAKPWDGQHHQCKFSSSFFLISFPIYSLEFIAFNTINFWVSYGWSIMFVSEVIPVVIGSRV